MYIHVHSMIINSLTVWSEMLPAKVICILLYTVHACTCTVCCVYKITIQYIQVNCRCLFMCLQAFIEVHVHVLCRIHLLWECAWLNPLTSKSKRFVAIRPYRPWGVCQRLGIYKVLHLYMRVDISMLCAPVNLQTKEMLGCSYLSNYTERIWCVFRSTVL